MTPSRSTRAYRSLFVAGALLVTWLALTIVSASSVQAHAGHRHVADAQLAVTHTPAGRADLAISDPDIAPPAVGFAPASLYRSEDDSSSAAERATTAMASLASPKTEMHCGCGGACGSCTSASCCSAVLAPLSDRHFRRPRTIENMRSTSASVTCAGVAPLPRPPNPPLPA